MSAFEATCFNWRLIILFNNNNNNPEGTQIIVGSMNTGYISDTTGNRTHSLFRLKREPIPLGHIVWPFSAPAVYVLQAWFWYRFQHIQCQGSQNKQNHSPDLDGWPWKGKSNTFVYDHSYFWLGAVHKVCTLFLMIFDSFSPLSQTVTNLGPPSKRMSTLLNKKLTSKYRGEWRLL